MTQATERRPAPNGRQVSPGRVETGAPPRTLAPSGVRNGFFHWLGGLVLVANRVRHGVRGYQTPRPFPTGQISRAVQYDLGVVEGWLNALRRYAGRDFSPQGRSVLELGPGPDLGTGLILLSLDARAYHALDVVDLALRAPRSLYDELLTHLEVDEATDRASLRSEIDALLAGQYGRLRFVCDPRFDVRLFAGHDIDLVVSQAAFEHFENPGKVIAQLSEVVTPGAILVSEVDLQTHSRWLRDADPLNIYRFSDRVYDALRFAGSPNRWRPAEYVDSLRRNGWRDIEVTPVTVLEAAYVSRVQPTLNHQFRSRQDQMEVLHFVICARKA